MAVSIYNCSSVISGAQSVSPMRAIWDNISPLDSITDLSSYDGHHFSRTLSSPSSSNDSSDIIDDHDDNPPLLKRKSRFQMPQRNCGDDIDFEVEVEGKETFQARNIYYVRQGDYFSLGINFADVLHNDLTHMFVRITPSWSVQRPDASTIIYCCDKHLKNSPSVPKLEKYSMLRMGPAIVGDYDIDESSDRLTILVPMAKKDRTAPFWINLKSECFSTCGSSQKKSHHLITVTLEIIRDSQKSIIGRKILHMKFSSSPSRDIRNRSKVTVDIPIGNLLPKRCDVAKRPAISPNRIKQPTKTMRTITDDITHDSSQVTFLPIKKKYVEQVKLFLKQLQQKEGEQDNICHYESDIQTPLTQDLVTLTSITDSLNDRLEMGSQCNSSYPFLKSIDSSMGVADSQSLQYSFVSTPTTINSSSPSDSCMRSAADAELDDFDADLLSLLEGCESSPQDHPGNVTCISTAVEQQVNDVRYSSFFLPDTSTVISAPLVAQSSTY